MPLDPVVQGMLQQMADAGGTPLTEMPPAEAREMYRMMSAGYTRADMHEVTDTLADGVPVRVYRPTAATNQPCLVFFHGGGWVIGDLDTHDNVCRNLALGAGCTVVAVDYRLAPEHPYPAPLSDCYTATAWVASHSGQLSIDPNRIAVGGDSAGGNLSAAVSLMALTRGGPRLVHQLLMYPVMDFNFETASYRENGEGYLLTRQSMEWFFGHYLAGGVDGNDPLVSPLRAADVSGLPPATVITAEYDPLRDEGEAFGQRLRMAGIDVKIERYPGMVHGFIHMSDILAQGRQATDLAAARLQSAFNG